MFSGLKIFQLKNFALVTASNFFFFCNYSAFFLLPLYINSLGGNKETVGFVMGTFGITSFGSIPLVSFLIDKYGRRRFTLFGALLMSLSSLSFIFVSELSPLIYLLRLIQGVGFAFFFTSATTSAADIIPTEMMGQGLGIFGAFTIASYALGPTIGEAVIYKFGFYYFFVICSLFSLVAFILVLFSRDTGFTPADDPYGIKFFRLAFSKRYLVLLLTNLILASGFGSVLNFISVFLRSKKLEIFYFFLIYTVTVTFIRLLGGRLSDMFSRKGIASPSLLLFSISIAAVAFIDSLYMVVIVSLLFSIGYGMLYPTLSALVVDKSGIDERGKAIGAFNACFSIGINYPTFVFGVIAERFGFEVMYIISAMVVFIGFMIFSLFESK